MAAKRLLAASSLSAEGAAANVGDDKLPVNGVRTIHDLLQEYRSRIKNKRDLGTSFEHLVKAYLESDPLYKDRFVNVWLWSSWPHNWGADCGIDLVAEDREGDFTAIQCKFFSPDHVIKKEDIDSFFTESGRTFKVDGKKASFTRRMIVSTSDQWSEHAEKSLHGQTIEVHRIGLHDLECSPIDWSKFSLDKPEKVAFRPKKSVRPHQVVAISKVIEGFKTSNRGKLIMACGTGKTFTALRLAEKMVAKNGTVLFLVPSISLLSQTLREWTAEAEAPFHALAVCSDSKVGKHSEDISKHDLAIPATTDSRALVEAMEKAKADKRKTVVFSTYQSIKVISDAQKKGFPEFDLIICDEAHRTTGVKLLDEEESHFVKVHDERFLRAQKRLYMTATPRIYGDEAKTKASEGGAELCSMDDEGLYGPEFHRLGFGEAVSNGLLADYKVLVLAVDEKHISQTFQKKIANDDGEIPFDDLVKIVGCWNGLSKKFMGDEAKLEDPRPMRRAVAFAQRIKDSKHIANAFETVVREYVSKTEGAEGTLKCELQHVDGSFNALERNSRLDWLKADAPENTCRILTNARCLSEGVDVPALDAVLFLNPRDSIVDVVQSVGRIMRQAPGKKYGYVILPIGIPAGVEPDAALKDNKKYKVVWQVLQALRAHDDRFNATINQIELNKKRPSNIQVIGVGASSESETPRGAGKPASTQLSLNLPELEQWKNAIYARIVLRCGSRPYWENWAADVAKIAEKHSEHINALLKSADAKPKKAFEKFLNGIRKSINPAISETEAIEMLSQHLITKPVFDALFEHYHFTEKNPVSQSMQAVLKVLESGSLREDAAKLKTFYDSVRLRVKGIDNAEGRQRIIVELYDRFFKVAFPKMSERLGIVYTPVEIVDFILYSVEAVLNEEFNQSVTNKNVHIIDPFTGTGTFIVRLLQSGLIDSEDIERKFKHELHANEIVLLAYYIAAINIEETYHGITGGEYTPYDGIVLTDTFQLTEAEVQGEFEAALPENNERARKQKGVPIKVVIGNPPYSAQQDSENDNNRNLDYPVLDRRIEDTYAKESSAQSKKNLYDSYLRAIRWATDRITEKGIVGFVTNGSFLDATNMDGVRKSISREFAKLYCFNLRGDQRTSGEQSKKEGGKVFGSGSRTPVAITVFVKNREHLGPCEIYYHDIGDYLSREDKLKLVNSFGSIKGIPWKKIEPNQFGDWVNQRSPGFDRFIPLTGAAESIFEICSLGVGTNRDPWTYNFSKSVLAEKMAATIACYNSEVRKIAQAAKKRKNIDDKFVIDVVDKNPKKISWSSSLVQSARRQKSATFDIRKIVTSSYRPYTKQALYFDGHMNHRTGQLFKLFPTPKHQNIVISIIGVVDRKGFSAIATDNVPNLHLVDSGQCFPLYFYKKVDEATSNLSAGESPDGSGYVRKDAVSDVAARKFREAYNDKKISKEDIFYYIYGLLHSPDYRAKYHSDLKKMLPRIPFAKDFWAFSRAGRELAEWHLSYETVEPYDLDEEISAGAPRKQADLYRVNEAGMKFPKVGKKQDRTSIIYNPYVVIKGIPLETYEYIVNGKPALDSVIERYRITVDKDSGIKNDPNEWSEDPRYIIDLVKRVVRVSLETNRIVKSLPALEILSEGAAQQVA